MTEVQKFNNMEEEFELIPDPDDETSWNVRLLGGPFPETVLKYDAIKMHKEEEALHFSFKIVSSPDPELTVENKEMQAASAYILGKILDEGSKKGALVNKETGEKFEG